MELTEKLHHQIVKLCKKGDQFIKRDKFDQALKMFHQALEMIPAPKTNWEAGTWVYSAIGDCYFFKQEFEQARNYLYDAYNCPGGIANPFILLRLGECLFEGNEFEKSRDFLLRAYMLEGEDIFLYEDPKYLESIKTIIERE